MNLSTEPYLAQTERWPSQGRHILAQFDDQSVVVYQAYRPKIGRFAAENGYFGGEFSLSRMTWIKPNFLWMMYRCGWATKSDQETVLAIRIRRSAFDSILATAVASSFGASSFSNREEWQQAVASSDVRLQWDPDHTPTGAPTARRAVQLGLRGNAARHYAKDWLVDVQDITPFVKDQASNAAPPFTDLLIPAESPYPVEDTATRKTLGLD